MSPIDPKLIEAYRNAVYRIRDKHFRIKFFVGSPSPELDDILRQYAATTAAFITACNPQSRVCGLDENQQRHENLLNTLATMRLKWLDGDGGDPAGHWESEKSVLILDIGKQSATTLAIEYEQNAFVWIQRDQPPELLLTR